MDAHRCSLAMESFLCRCLSPRGPLSCSPGRARDEGVTQKVRLTMGGLGKRICQAHNGGDFSLWPGIHVAKAKMEKGTKRKEVGDWGGCEMWTKKDSFTLQYSAIGVL